MGKRRLSVGQLILLGCVVVALVFGVTYLSINTPGKTKPGGGEPSASPTLLNFSEKQWPVGDDPTKESAAIAEWHVEGHHNFWFENVTASPVDVTLHDKTCKCTRVEIALLPEELKGKPKAELDSGSAAGPKLDWHILDVNDNKGFTVPGRAAGAVRLNWKPEKLGKERLAAGLQTQGVLIPGEPISLSVNLDLVPPLQVCAEDSLKEENPDKEIQVGTLAAGDVRKVNLVAWSSTRENISLKVEPPDNPCIRCGAPERLSPEECAKLGQATNKRLLCAYRVPLTVREQTEDGKQFDLGRFRKYIQFSSDPWIEPVPVAVGGMVRGEVTVGTPDDHDMVMLGSFQRETGVSRTIPVTTTEGKLELEVEQIPEFLKVNLTEEKLPGLLGKVWHLTVAVPPDGLTGEIPRHTRIMLKTKGDRPRRISIPVTGNAYVR